MGRYTCVQRPWNALLSLSPPTDLDGESILTALDSLGDVELHPHLPGYSTSYSLSRACGVCSPVARDKSDQAWDPSFPMIFGSQLHIRSYSVPIWLGCKFLYIIAYR